MAAQPVERFFNTTTGTHFYTISQTEKNFVIANYPVFVYEGPAYYAMTATGTDRTDLYRFYNTKTGAHFYTTSPAERDHVIGDVALVHLRRRRVRSVHLADALRQQRRRHRRRRRRSLAGGTSTDQPCRVPSR